MKVYKYTPHVSLFLENSALKLTPTFQLNDPFEAKVTNSFASNFEIEFKKHIKGMSNEHVAKMMDGIKNKGRYKGIVSLSTKFLDILMLSHYASDHKGGILEFELDCMLDGYNNKTEIFQRSNNGVYNFGRVKYSKIRRSDLNEDFDKYLSSGVYFEKYLDWKYEEEVRYVSDFRNADFFIIPKHSLLKSYFENFKRNGTIDIVSWHIEGDSFYYTFEDFDWNSSKELLYRSKKKKVRSIVGKIFKNNILTYQETTEDIILGLKYSHNSDFAIDQALSWNRFLSDTNDFHPMLRVNRSALTGLYLGCRFDTSELKKNSLDKFPNLSENIKQSKLCENDFKLNLVNFLETCK